MLKNSHLLVLQRAQAALRSRGEATLADQLQAIVTEQLAQRSKATDTKSAAAQARGAKPGRPPSVVYTVELEPGWRATVVGLAVAHKLLARAMAELDALALLPKRTSLGVALSQGSWDKLVETANGMVSVSVRRETGTDVA